MKLLFRQKFFSILDSFEIYDESDNVVFNVKSVFDIKHHFKIYDVNGNEVGELKEKFFAFLHTFIMLKDGREFGQIVKEFTFFKPKFTIKAKGYSVDGSIFEWDYNVYKDGKQVATVEKQLLRLTDTYVIDVEDEYVIDVLMIVLAIDAVKCDHDDDVDIL